MYHFTETSTILEDQRAYSPPVAANKDAYLRGIDITNASRVCSGPVLGDSCLYIELRHWLG